MAKATKKKAQQPKGSHGDLSAAQRDELLAVLQARFEKHMKRHAGLQWPKVEEKLVASPARLRSLAEMERTGGEPDVIGYDKKADEYVFCDCSEETPAGRKNVCYDREALDARKEHKPATSALDMAAQIGVELLSRAEYQQLQTLGDFDLKTSSWLKTEPDIRKLGGAIFGDKRYGAVFIYHNGAQSYYGARAFRGLLRV